MCVSISREFLHAMDEANLQGETAGDQKIHLQTILVGSNSQSDVLELAECWKGRDDLAGIQQRNRATSKRHTRELKSSGKALSIPAF